MAAARTATITITVETFGSDGVGTCDLDTVLYLRDRDGNELAMDDDGGPGTCSSITYDLPATGAYPATVVFAHVMEKGDDDPAGLYFLRVSYP